MALHQAWSRKVGAAAGGPVEDREYIGYW